MNDYLSRFGIGESEDGNTFCVVTRYRNQPAMVCAFFSAPLLRDLTSTMSLLQPHKNGRWRVGDVQTTMPSIRNWLHKHGAWEMLLSGDSLMIGDHWREPGAWKQYLQCAGNR